MARFAVIEVVIIGMKAVGTLQVFFFLVGSKRGKTLLTPSRLDYILRSTTFTDKIRAHGLLMLETEHRFFILRWVPPEWNPAKGGGGVRDSGRWFCRGRPGFLLL